MIQMSGLTSLLSNIWESKGFITLTQIDSVVEIIDEKSGIIMQIIKLDDGEYECVKLKKTEKDSSWAPIKNKTKVVPEIGEVQKWLEVEAAIKEANPRNKK